jgi:hypothetical protein
MELYLIIKTLYWTNLSLSDVTEEHFIILKLTIWNSSIKGKTSIALFAVYKGLP